MADVFNNPSNDYIYPGLAPCPNVADDQYLQWTPDGLSVIKGSEILSTITFSDLAIPVNSFSKEQKLLGPGEVTFIPGLGKGLCKRKQGFTMPSLVSTDETSNPLFLNVDLSLNYYKNFTFTQINIEASANYGDNIDIEDALNIVLNTAKIKVSANYDASTLTFQGTQEGYEFNISNVLLGIVDASENSASPFPTNENADSYVLDEDASLNVLSAKYPNSASQGIILRAIYPGSPVCEWDKWLWINHVTDYITVYEPIVIENFIADVSAFMRISFDPSTLFGCGIAEPDTDVSIGVVDVSIADVDVSIADFSIDDASINYIFLTDPSKYQSVVLP